MTETVRAITLVYTDEMILVYNDNTFASKLKDSQIDEVFRLYEQFQGDVFVYFADEAIRDVWLNGAYPNTLDGPFIDALEDQTDKFSPPLDEEHEAASHAVNPALPSIEWVKPEGYAQEGDRVWIAVPHPETGEVVTAFVEILADKDGAFTHLNEETLVQISGISRSEWKSVIPERDSS